MIDITTRPTGYLDVVANGTRFVIHPEQPGGARFVSASNQDWASVPVGHFRSLGAAIDRTLQPFTFPSLADAPRQPVEEADERRATAPGRLIVPAEEARDFVRRLLLRAEAQSD